MYSPCKRLACRWPGQGAAGPNRKGVATDANLAAADTGVQAGDRDNGVEVETVVEDTLELGIARLRLD